MGICKVKFDHKKFTRILRAAFGTFVLSVGIIGFGCSGSTDGLKNSSTDSKSSPSTSEIVNSNVLTSNIIPSRGSLQERKERKRRIITEPSGKPIPLIYKKAAENSEIAVTMNDDGSVLEIRVFRDHPMLIKVEATRLGEKDKALKIYLQNGKTLDVKTDRVPNLGLVSSSEILQIAGINGQSKTAEGRRMAGQR